MVATANEVLSQWSLTRVQTTQNLYHKASAILNVLKDIEADRKLSIHRYNHLCKNLNLFLCDSHSINNINENEDRLFIAELLVKEGFFILIKKIPVIGALRNLGNFEQRSKENFNEQFFSEQFDIFQKFCLDNKLCSDEIIAKSRITKIISAILQWIMDAYHWIKSKLPYFTINDSDEYISPNQLESRDLSSPCFW